MGPKDLEPALPGLEWAQLPASNRMATKWIQETNYLPKHARNILKDKEANNEISVDVAAGQKRRKGDFPAGRVSIVFPP